MLVKKYFSFNYPGEKLLLIFVVFYAIILVPYVITIFSVIDSGGDFENFDFMRSLQFLVALYLWIFIVALASILLRIFILKKFVRATRYHNDNFDFTGSIWKFLFICIRDFILSLASFGIYYSWFMENIFSFIFSNIKLLGQPFEFMSKGGVLLRIFLIYYLVPIGIYYYLYYTTFLSNMIGFDTEDIFGMYLQMSGMILLLYVLLIPFWYNALKWLLNLEHEGREICLHDDSWSSLGIIARELIISLATFGIYFPAALIRLYIYFVSHIGISGQEGTNFVRFEDILVNKGFKYIWGQLLLSIISWGIYFPFAVCRIIKWFANKTYLLVYQEDEYVDESNDLALGDSTIIEKEEETEEQ